MNKKQSIIKENLIYFKDADITDYELLSYEDNIYFFDTENCPQLPEDLVNKYKLDQIEMSTIPEFQSTKEGSILHKCMKDKTLYTTVYLWMFGCHTSDKVYYGNTIQEFIDFIQKIDEYTATEHGKVHEYKIYVHNLAWDIEFFKYWFKEHQFKQIRVSQDKKETAKNRRLENHFDITETDGTVHNATIQLNKVSIKKGRKKVNYLTTIKFFDSHKITPMSLEKISKKLLVYKSEEEKEMYTKDGSKYLYELIRTPEGYKPNDIESWYIYCDIYLLKEWYIQVVEGFYMNTLGLKNVYTISQIAFDSVLKMTYNDNKLRHELTPPGAKELSDREIYENHFALKIIDANKNISEYLRLSYKGGHCTASKKYKSIASIDDNIIEGSSMDITSSYPSQMCYKALPFGIPSPIKEGRYQNFTDYLGREFNYHFITVGFDGWYSKNNDNQFGLNLKIYGLNEHQKKELEWTPNESYSDNIVDGQFVGNNRIIVKDKKRKEKIDKLSYKYVVTLTHHEFELWCEQFNFIRYEEGQRLEGVHFIDYVSFQSEVGHFKKGLDYFFALKDKAEMEGNEPLRENCKTLLNSFYGKHCSKRDRQQRFYNFNNDIISFAPVSDNNEDYNFINEWLDKKLYAVHYGSAVTSHGRCQLRSTCIKVGQDKFVYADTDSLKFANMTKEQMIEICKEQGIQLSTCKEDKKLGAWDFEFEFVNFKAIGQKKYMYKIDGKEYTCKCAGLPGEIRSTIKDKKQFNIGSVYDKQCKKKVIGGNLLLYTEYSISDLTRI